MPDEEDERDDGIRSMTDRTAYCASCKKVQPVTLIHGHAGERDRERCNGCLRTWPAGRRWPTRWRHA